MKKIIQISFFILTVISLITLTGAIVIKNRVKNIGEIKINIFRSTESGFISKTEVFKEIGNYNVDTSINKTDTLKIKEVRTSNIEEILRNNPYIEKVDSYITIDGNILINIKEKEPLIRIYDESKKGFYIDKKGSIFPLSKNYAPRVLISNGYINSKITNYKGNIHDSIFDNTVIREVFQLTQLINLYDLLKVQINQIYVNSKGEYDFIPELGDHIVQFGTFNEASIKLKNLDAYYHKYLKSSNWDNYKTINLTYKDQIVCTKK